MGLTERWFAAMGAEPPNLFADGDRTFTLWDRIEPMTNELPAGTYKFSANVQTTDTSASTTCILLFVTQASASDALMLQLPKTSGRTSVTFTLTKTYTKLILYASDNYMNSQGKTATYSGIRIERIG